MKTAIRNASMIMIGATVLWWATPSAAANKTTGAGGPGAVIDDGEYEDGQPRYQIFSLAEGEDRFVVPRAYYAALKRDHDAGPRTDSAFIPVRLSIQRPDFRKLLALYVGDARSSTVEDHQPGDLWMLGQMHFSGSARPSVAFVPGSRGIFSTRKPGGSGSEGAISVDFNVPISGNMSADGRIAVFLAATTQINNFSPCREGRGWSCVSPMKVEILPSKITFGTVVNEDMGSVTITIRESNVDLVMVAKDSEGVELKREAVAVEAIHAQPEGLSMPPLDLTALARVEFLPVYSDPNHRFYASNGYLATEGRAIVFADGDAEDPTKRPDVVATDESVDPYPSRVDVMSGTDGAEDSRKLDASDGEDFCKYEVRSRMEATKDDVIVNDISKGPTPVTFRLRKSEKARLVLRTLKKYRVHKRGTEAVRELECQDPPSRYEIYVDFPRTGDPIFLMSSRPGTQD